MVAASGVHVFRRMDTLGVAASPSAAATHAQRLAATAESIRRTRRRENLKNRALGSSSTATM